MAKIKVSIGKLREVIESQLQDYQIMTNEAVENAIDNAAEKAIDFLRIYRPEDSEKYRKWDEYASGWDFISKPSRNYVTATIWNEKHYRLTHLLENGHALHQGGRAKAYPHIANAREQVDKILVDEVIKEVNKI